MKVFAFISVFFISILVSCTHESVRRSSRFDPVIYSSERVKLIADIVESGYNIDEPGWNSMTVLFHAAGLGDIDLVEYLLENGADPNFETHFGTPIGKAVAFGRIDCAILLLEYGGDPMVAFENAIFSVRLDLIEFLVENYQVNVSGLDEDVGFLLWMAISGIYDDAYLDAGTQSQKCKKLNDLLEMIDLLKPQLTEYKWGIWVNDSDSYLIEKYNDMNCDALEKIYVIFKYGYPSFD